MHFSMSKEEDGTGVRAGLGLRVRSGDARRRSGRRFILPYIGFIILDFGALKINALRRLGLYSEFHNRETDIGQKSGKDSEIKVEIVAENFIMGPKSLFEKLIERRISVE